MKLYLVVERVYEVLDIMGLKGDHKPKDGDIPLEFRKSTDGMIAMRDVKQWANFLKHPGAFLWCHDPEFWCESLDDTVPAGDEVVIINQDVVNTHYQKCPKKHKELYQKIAGKPNIHVVYPKLEDLTKLFCHGIRDFCDTATCPLFKPFLRKRSTFENYYEYWDKLYETADEVCDTDTSETSDESKIIRLLLRLIGLRR